MNILIKKAKIIDKNSSFDGKTMDLLIEDGTITQIAESIDKKDLSCIEKEGLHVSMGWVELKADFSRSVAIKPDKHGPYPVGTYICNPIGNRH